MQRIRFQPVSNLILIPVKVMGIDGNNFRDIEVALDTGATTTSIPIMLFRLWDTMSQIQRV